MRLAVLSSGLVAAATAGRIVIARWLCTILVLAGATGWGGPAKATLLDRGPDMVYDTVLNITWARNANLAGQPMTQDQALAWVNSLVLDGISGWRLPTISVSGLNFPLMTEQPGYASSFTYACAAPVGESICQDDELGYMYWYDLNGNGLSETGNQISYLGAQLIENLQDIYWSGTVWQPGYGWVVYFTSAGAHAGWFQAQPPDSFPTGAWAVHDGDVANQTPVPEPATLALLSGALLGFILTCWRRKTV